MAKVIEYQNLMTFLVLLNFVFVTSARPISLLKAVSCPDDANIELFDRFYLGSIKDGPSPGIGHGFENKAPLGGIKYASIYLGGIKDGPSPGIGHKIVDAESLGGRKNSGPSPGDGH
ncbi:hypothetical protein R6Q59_034708 [Mikania micrantha]